MFISTTHGADGSVLTGMALIHPKTAIYRTSCIYPIYFRIGTLDPRDCNTSLCIQELTFETQYLAAISLVTAILFGNTFAFSFDRQRQIIQEMAEEIFALELLLQELFIDIPEPHLRWRVIKNIKCVHAVFFLDAITCFLHVELRPMPEICMAQSPRICEEQVFLSGSRFASLLSYSQTTTPQHQYSTHVCLQIDKF